MLKSFEYVDPLLAQKIHNLESELKKVRQAKQELTNNTKLATTTREKLTRYQTECEKNIQKMLSEQKDKLAQYLDQQTNAITKTNRLSSSRAVAKPNATLNQSTRLEFETTDDSKSLDVTKTQINRKVSSFYMASTERHNRSNNTKFPNKHVLRVKLLKKKVSKQQKLIKMLVTWVKIYYEREQTYKQTLDSDTYVENEKLKKENFELTMKCKNIEQQIRFIRQQVKNKADSIMRTQQKYDQVKNQNSGLKMQRKQLLSNARSLRKTIQD